MGVHRLGSALAIFLNMVIDDIDRAAEALHPGSVEIAKFCGELRTLGNLGFVSNNLEGGEEDEEERSSEKTTGGVVG